MNKHLKEFLHRGLIFSGFGPIVVAIVFIILDLTGVPVSLTGTQVFMAVISTYIIAFVHAGSSVFHQIENWPVSKALICQLSMLYAVYTLAYIINSWIPFEPVVLIIYTAAFIVGYLLICLIVYLSIRATSKRLNSGIK
ncbi:MAG: DUF3021 domain-containing protein [Clostridia bacterium]|nr:DUF3021 domain-containing protein [Clostridia bacterium]